MSARDIPGSSDPVPIAGDRRSVPGSSDPVSTAGSHRGDGSYCDGGADFERQFPTLVARRQLSFKPEFVGSMSISDCTACRREVLKQGTKALCIYFGCCINTVEASLLLPGFLPFEHPQTTHSPESMPCASSLTRIRSRKRQLIASFNTSTRMFLTSLSSIDIFLIR